MFVEDYELQEADMHITCDNSFVLFINGKEVGRGNEWKDGKVFNVKDHLVRGKNVIAVRATNEGGPAGLVAWLVRLTKPGNHYTVLPATTMPTGRIGFCSGRQECRRGGKDSTDTRSRTGSSRSKPTGQVCWNRCSVAGKN